MQIRKSLLICLLVECRQPDRRVVWEALSGFWSSARNPLRLKTVTERKAQHHTVTGPGAMKLRYLGERHCLFPYEVNLVSCKEHRSIHRRIDGRPSREPNRIHGPQHRVPQHHSLVRFSPQ